MSEPEQSDPPESDVTRRTWLAAERTWLAWWRTGIAVAAVAIAVGRLLPQVAGGARWPWRVLGLGYGLLAIATLVLGAVRQHRTTTALRRASYEPLSSPTVMWLTAGAIVLALGLLALVVAAF